MSKEKIQTEGKVGKREKKNDFVPTQLIETTTKNQQHTSKQKQTGTQRRTNMG